MNIIMKKLILLLILISPFALAESVPMSSLVEGDKLLVSSDGVNFTERLFVNSCYVKTDTGFKETIVISERATGSSLFTWQNKYTKTLSGDLVIADVVTMFPAASPPPAPVEYRIPKSQLDGVLTQLIHLVEADDNRKTSNRAVSDIFDRWEEIALELREIKRVLPKDGL